MSNSSQPFPRPHVSAQGNVTTRVNPLQVIAVTGGKGGVGKTHVSANVAVALSEAGQRVMLLDADLGLANVAVMLGMHAPRGLAHVLSGEAELADVILTGPANVRVVPGSSGMAGMADLPAAVCGGVIRAFGDLSGRLDTLIVDTAAGASDAVLSFARAAQELIVVVCDEPTSIADAFALIRLLSRGGVRRFYVLASMTRTVTEGPSLYTRLDALCERYLDVVLEYLGAIPFDESVRHAIQRQQPVVQLFPDAPASRALREIADRINAWPRANLPGGHLQFFFERLLGSTPALGEVV